MTPLSASQLRALRHPNEGLWFAVTLLVLVPVAILAAGLVVLLNGLPLFAVPIILFMLWFGSRAFVARHLHNSVRVDERSFPVVYEAILEAQQLFGYRGRIDAFVVQNGDYNASLYTLLGRKYLLINSEVLANEKDRDHIRFLVGRFVGALTSKHYRFGWLQAVLSSVETIAIFNMLLTPYERTVQLSGDQFGLYMIAGDTRTAISVMLKFAVGNEISDRVSVTGFLHQIRANEMPFFSWLVKSVSTHPHLSKRVENLLSFTREWNANPDRHGPVFNDLRTL